MGRQRAQSNSLWGPLDFRQTSGVPAPLMDVAAYKELVEEFDLLRDVH
jgi:hypothetical protein